MVPEVGATTRPTAQDCTKTIASKVGDGIGLVTPPVGMCIYVACDLMHIRVGQTMKYLVWYILGTFVVIAILITFPQLITITGSFL